MGRGVEAPIRSPSEKQGAFALGSGGSCEIWLDIRYVSNSGLKGFANKLNLEYERE